MEHCLCAFLERDTYDYFELCDNDFCVYSGWKEYNMKQNKAITTR